jgi:anti-sigma factor RsiW
MTGRVLSFIQSRHQRTQELLPWYANGTLDAEEGAQVEEHLQACPGCRSELECVRLLQASYIGSEMPPDAGAALAKLRPRLDEAEPAHRPHRSGRPQARPASMVPAWFKLALAGQFALIFVLGWQVLQPGGAGSEFHTLASAGTAQRAAGSLVVVFDPAAPQREVARILRLAGGRIVDGPTASNAYVVSVAPADLRAALAQLHADPAVVLAEPLEAAR